MGDEVKKLCSRGYAQMEFADYDELSRLLALERHPWSTRLDRILYSWYAMGSWGSHHYEEMEACVTSLASGLSVPEKYRTPTSPRDWRAELRAQGPARCMMRALDFLASPAYDR